MTASKATAASELAAMGLEDLASEYGEAIYWGDEKTIKAAGAELRHREERERRLLEAMAGIEIIDEHIESEGCVWLLLLSNGKDIGAGSIRIDGEHGKAWARYAENRRAALAEYKEPNDG